MFCGKINSSKFKLQDLCHQIGEIEWTVKINQRVPNANLWIINYCILEVKADNEPAVSLLVYFKSVKKWKCFTKKKNKQTKGTKKQPSSPFHINAIFELVPFLSQKSEEMQFVRAFFSSTAKTSTVTSSFYFMIFIRTVPPFNEKKKFGINLCSVFLAVLLNCTDWAITGPTSSPGRFSLGRGCNWSNGACPN